MKPAEHDPLQFGQEEVALDSDDAPPAYGGADEDAAAAASHAERPAAAGAHDPLAAPPEPSAPPSWQHYPAPPNSHSPTSAAASPLTVAPAGGPQQQHYPSVPTPAAGFSAPFAGQAGFGSSSGGAALAAGNPELRISVHSPLKHTGPTGIPGLEEAYTSYEVTTSTSLPHFSGNRFTVRRRFRDFVSLSNLLPRLLHGSFLPARPTKNLIEGRRMSDAFVEGRRASLERYLNRLAGHPAAARSEALRVFLEADGALRSHPHWRALKPPVLSPVAATNRFVRTIVGARKTAPSPSEVVMPAADCRDVYRLLHENVAAMRGSFKHASLSAEELALRDDTVVVEDEAGALHVALHKAEAWGRAAAARAGLLADAATSLQALASYEASYPGYSDEATTGGLTAAGQAMHAAAAAAAAAASARDAVLQPLRDHHAITPNVLAALHCRERQLLTVNTLRRDWEDKKARLAAAQLTPASQAKRVDVLRTAVGQLEVSVAAAEAEYSRQLARNRDELAALRKSRASELVSMAQALVAGEARAAQAQAALWGQLARQLPAPALTTAGMAQHGFVLGPLS